MWLNFFRSIFYVLESRGNDFCKKQWIYSGKPTGIIEIPGRFRFK